MSVGFRVFTKRHLPDEKIVEGFRGIPCANVADVMGRSCALNCRIKNYAPKAGPMCGVALTVKARPGDNLMFHKALNLATKGDVVMVANEGDVSQSLAGAIMFAYAHSKGVEGIVVDGPIRDVVEGAELGINLYATGSTPGGPYKEGPGEINVPISVGNVAVNPGDIILGDEDGVIVVPRKDAEKILAEAIEFMKKDDAKMEAALNGRANRDWVDKALTAKGCEIIDGYCDE